MRSYFCFFSMLSCLAYADVEFCSPTSNDCLCTNRSMHVGIRHNEAQGIGYEEGYTTLEAFGIYDKFSDQFMPFVDIRGHVFNDGKLAGNLGIGGRTLLPSIDHFFGSYLYYDVRHVGKGLTVNQLSPGIELVGERMEYRINAYFPLGKHTGRKYQYKFDEFDGHSIYLKSKQYRALRGFDAEVGGHITQNTKYDLYAGAGPYYLDTSHASSWGGRVRLLGRYKEYVALEMAYSYDHLFRSRVEGSVALTIPFGRKLREISRCCPQMSDLVLSRAAFAPSRFEIPVVKKVHRKEKAINPATGEPWVVWFVNNTSHSAGTFESPFTTIAAASAASSPNDMIYVFPGNGNAYNEAVVLKDWQDFLGSGVRQPFATTNGTITIPRFSSTNPSITNQITNAITLGNGNVVSGFTILTGFNAGIASGPGQVLNATLANNIIRSTLNTATYGINLFGVGGVKIYNNQISAPVGSFSTGIGLEAAGGLVTGIINNNSISTDFAGIYVLPVATNAGSYNLMIQENTIRDYATAGITFNMKQTSTISIFGNTLINNANTSSFAIQVGDNSLTTSGNVIIDNNKIISSVSPGSNFTAISVALSGTSSPNIKTSVTKNSVIPVGSAGKGSFSFASGSTDTMCLTLENNIATGGFAFSTSGSGIINIDSLEGNVGTGVTSTGNVFMVPPGTCGN